MKINQLTFFRFLAAVIVVIFHYGRKSYFARLSPAMVSGPVMVLFFFVLSGFIMVVAYGNEGTLNKGKYWLARLARIVPVYYIALALTIGGALLSGAKIRFVPIVLHLLFLQAWFPPYALSLNGPAWSLSVEMFFYFFFPFLLSYFQKLSLGRVLKVSWAIWLVTISVLSFLFFTNQQSSDDNFVHQIIFYFPLSHLSSFVLGMAGGLVYNAYFATKRISPLVTIPLVSFSFGMIALLLHYHSKIKWLAMWSYAYGLLSPLFLMFIFFVAIDRSFLAKALSNPVFTFLGELGYSIYILQNPLHRLYDYVLSEIRPLLGVNNPLGVENNFYLYLLTLIVLSACTYLLIEKPARQKLRQFTDKLIAIDKPIVIEHSL